MTEKDVRSKVPSADQLQSLFRESPTGMAILMGPDFVIDVINQAMLRLIDKPAEAVADRPAFDAVSEARGRGFEEVFGSVYSSGEPISIPEAPVSLFRGGTLEELYVQVSCEPFRERDGRISGVIVYATEITDQVLARKRIEDYEIQQGVANDAGAVGTFQWSIGDSYFQYSPRLAQMFGLPVDRVLSQAEFIERIHPDDLAIRNEAHKAAHLTGNLFYEIRVIWADGTIRWIRLSGKSFSGTSASPDRMFGAAVDITDLKSQSEALEKAVAARTAKLLERQTQLQQSEERYHKMVEEVQDYAIILLDKNGVVQNWNLGAESIKGYSEEEIVGNSFEVFYPEPDRLARLPQKLLNDARTTGRATHEGWRVRKDGSMFWGSIVITALHDNTGEIIGFSKVTRDLTERKVAQDQLMQYTQELESQNKELEQFAYVASHDLQEPLRKIQTFAEIVQSNQYDEATRNKYFEKIKTSAHRMSELIRSVLNYSKLANDPSQKVPTDLNQVVERAIMDFELLIQEKNARLIVEPLPTIKAIPVQLSQLFANLIGNALKFNAGEPIVTIRSRILRAEEVTNLPSHITAHTLCEISITDNGIGFEQQYERQIFGMFQRLHGRHQFGGTGIGLALCKKVVENHHGHITAESELGIGSTFRVYFPAE